VCEMDACVTWFFLYVIFVGLKGILKPIAHKSMNYIEALAGMCRKFEIALNFCRI
jgi:hypothetical protein